MPCRHIRAGIAYLGANRRSAGVAVGCWLARKKSWCSWSRARWSGTSGVHVCCRMLASKEEVVVFVKQCAMQGYQRLPRDLRVINFDIFAFNHDEASKFAVNWTAEKLLASLMLPLVLIHLLQCNIDSSDTLAMTGFASRLWSPCGRDVTIPGLLSLNLCIR